MGEEDFLENDPFCFDLPLVRGPDDAFVFAGTVPFISDAEAERMFANQGGFRKIRPYLRYVRHPSLRYL